MRLALSWPITYWSRIEPISCGVGRSERVPLAAVSAVVSSRMMSLQRSMHSSQMNTDGPAMSFFTSCWLLPQKEQYRSLSPDFLSVIAGSVVSYCRSSRLAAAGDHLVHDAEV